jgi:hypothetical protein
MIFNALQRIEAKVESTRAETTSPRLCENTQLPDSPALLANNPGSDRSHHLGSELNSPYERPLGASSSPTQIIPYDTHRFIFWPAIKSILREHPTLEHLTREQIYATHLEQKRPPLSPYVPKAGAESSTDFLSRLSISSIKALTDEYFSTWNLATPVLDRDAFSQYTLGVAINSSFDYNIESCLLLIVLALGCLGRRALKQGGFKSSSYEILTGDAAQDHSAQLFFDESRKRMSFLLCDQSMQSCQYNILAGSVWFIMPFTA